MNQTHVGVSTEVIVLAASTVPVERDGQEDCVSNPPIATVRMVAPVRTNGTRLDTRRMSNVNVPRGGQEGNVRIKTRVEVVSMVDIVRILFGLGFCHGTHNIAFVLMGTQVITARLKARKTRKMPVEDVKMADIV